MFYRDLEFDAVNLIFDRPRYDEVPDPSSSLLDSKRNSQCREGFVWQPSLPCLGMIDGSPAAMILLRREFEMRSLCVTSIHALGSSRGSTLGGTVALVPPV